MAALMENPTPLERRRAQKAVLVGTTNSSENIAPRPQRQDVFVGHEACIIALAASSIDLDNDRDVCAFIAALPVILPVRGLVPNILVWARQVRDGRTGAQP
jgi:hypothetical protein